MSQLHLKSEPESQFTVPVEGSASVHTQGCTLSQRVTHRARGQLVPPALQSPLRISEASDPQLATSDLQVLNCLVPGTQALLWDCTEPSLSRKHTATDPLGLKNHRGRRQGKNTAPVSSLPLVPILSCARDLAPWFQPFLTGSMGVSKGTAIQ